MFDTLAGVAGRFSTRPDRHTKSAPWWSEVLATARETDPIVYRKLCKEVRVNFYRERVASAWTPAEWGKILRWRIGHSDDRPTVMVGNGRVISDTERMAAYLATQALACRGQEGSRPAWPGPRLPPEWAARLADQPSDNELRDAFFGTTSNTPSPDGVPLAFLRHTWELVRPATRAIAEGCIKWGAFPKAFKQATVVILSKPGRDP